MRLVPLGAREIPAMAALLARAWPDGAFTRADVRAILGADPPGTAAAAIGVRDGRALVGCVALAARGASAWIKVAAVDPACARRGVLRALVDAAASWARARGAKRLRIFDHAGNYVTPGIDERCAGAIAALRAVGFRDAGFNVNLRCPTRPPGEAPALPGGVTARRARAADRDALLALAGAFTPAWAHELSRAMRRRTPTVHAAFHGGAPIAFAVHSVGRRGTFGPTGTLEAWRGRRIGEALLRACLRDLARAGLDHALVQWVGPSPFYEKLGATVAGRYVALVKDLS